MTAPAALIATFGAVAASLLYPPASAAKLSCGMPIAGSDQVLEASFTVLLGETHGTREAPAFAGDLSCLAVRRGLAVVVLLELSRREEPAFARYLASAGTAADRRELLTTPFWQTEFPDGRSSWAVVDLLETMRQLARARHQVQVLGMFEDNPYKDGDREMAESLLSARQAAPQALLIALAGDYHTRVGDIEGGPPHKSMGQYLREANLPKLVSLEMVASPGTFWGISGAPGIHSFPGRARGRQRFIRIGGGMTEPAFDGVFYTVSATADQRQLFLPERRQLFLPVGHRGVVVVRQ